IPGGAHYIFGNLTPPEVIATRTGTLSMIPSGGTTPTSNGSIFLSGTGTTYPTLSLDFDTRNVKVGAFSWSFTSGTFDFSRCGTGTIFAVPGGAGVKASLAGTFSSNVPATAAMSGAFFGPAGDHLGMGIGLT